MRDRWKRTTESTPLFVVRHSFPAGGFPFVCLRKRVLSRIDVRVDSVSHLPVVVNESMRYFVPLSMPIEAFYSHHSMLSTVSSSHRQSRLSPHVLPHLANPHLLHYHLSNC